MATESIQRSSSGSNLLILDQSPPEDSNLNSISNRVFKNPFFWALCLTGAAAIVITFSVMTLPADLAALAIIGTIALLGITHFVQDLRTKKLLFCDFSLLITTLATNILPASWLYPWYSEITPNITLGASPLKTRGHLEELVNSGHTAVISMIEDPEREPHLMGVPIQPHDWEDRLGRGSYANFPNPDLNPVAVDVVEAGVEQLNTYITQGKKVYVHCTGGVGRSATIVICYLIKYQNITMEAAVAFVRDRRWIMASENSPGVYNFVARLEASRSQAN